NTILIDKNHDVNKTSMQQQTTATYGNNNEQPSQLNKSNEALTYAVERNLSTLKIECIPLLENREHATKICNEFF
ncbi:unnamed protein product, partial [Rotaria sp. Silwood1]